MNGRVHTSDSVGLDPFVTGLRVSIELPKELLSSVQCNTKQELVASQLGL